MTQDELVATIAHALDTAGRSSMIVGSFASSLHGAPRTTQDGDIVVDAPLQERLAAMERLGEEFDVSVPAAREAHRARRPFTVIHVDTGFQVALIVRKDRPFSETEPARRQRGLTGGQAVSSATPEDTLLAKLERARAADPDRQYADACSVAEVNAPTFDWDYVERWAGDLDVAELVERVRAGKPFRDR